VCDRERERENCLILKFDKVGKAAFWAEILKLFAGLNTERNIYPNYIQKFVSYLKENTVRVR